MYFKEFQDYPVDTPLVKEKVYPGKGIIGCEMHEINGWGTHLHAPKIKNKSLWARMIRFFFGKNK